MTTLDCLNKILKLFNYEISPVSIITKLSQSKDKHHAMLQFREHILVQYEKWYDGIIGQLYEEPSPTEEQKVKVGTHRENAILTWAKLHQEKKYIEDLQLDEYAFRGMKILDVGSGPIPSALAFKECNVFCLDPLVPEFYKLGYPFWHYDSRAKFIYGYSESMPFPNNYFDGVISVNAIDHVDDFLKTSLEIKRVIKQNGKLRLHIHYHLKTKLEPIELSDPIVLSAFSWCEGFKKINASKKKRGTTLNNDNELFAVWSNF
jgi:SAM-dependent methyltransferase